MNKPPHKKNPTFGIAVFIVVAMLVVIFTLVYNAIREKHEFENQSASAAPLISSGVAAAATVLKPASGAAQ
ncbi:putative signal peptide transmembrane protein [Paraburkholderia ribeironis]|uniref:Putative signal peptide transmembrane protein n=1 Tax=Paraburkholderia ribeironis TaxID=1247936 RepID=A0A1N7S6A9_9BURK|nr:hypothetical protein [Paraburkholderia ribeironis]SIT42954.1 putative signal peptide transmembrane protein [Paraburkholderia ribeironis]